MFSFSKNKASLEHEGIFVGGWDPRGVIIPRKVDGKHGMLAWECNNSTMTDAIQSLAKTVFRVRREPNLNGPNKRRGLWCEDWTFVSCYLAASFTFWLTSIEEICKRCKTLCRLSQPQTLMLSSGNVKILGAGTKNSLEHSLHLKGTEFNWAVSITYFAVTAGLLPANIAMKKFSAKLFLPVIMIMWGAVVLAISGVNNATGLLAARFFLGIPEAAVVPSCIMYFSMWYKPSERAFRIAIFHAWNCVASAVSSFLASGIGKMEGVGGLHAWQW